MEPAAQVSYAVKEIFYTLQGEGRNTGRAAVFCRFAGCNLWSGREEDRAGAVCRFCDTDFVGFDPTGGRFETSRDLADAILRSWGDRPGARPFVVLTGGEPLLQVDEALLSGLRERGFEIALETNGTIAVPPGVDWVCVSPKAGAPLAVTRGDELKLVYPQPGLAPESLEGLAFDHLLLSPMDGPDARANVASAVAYCLAHPRWRLNVQTHKLVGVR